MDVEVIDVGEGSGNQAMSNGGDAEPGEGEVNSSGNPRSRVGDGVSEPYVGMEFDSEDAAKTFYCEYARRLGFSSKAGPHGQVKADGTNMYCEFVCGSDREGLKRKLTESCNAMIRIEQKGQNKWVVTKFVKEHSHSMVIPPSKVNNLQPRRHFSSVGRLMPETYQGVGLVPSGIMYVSMDVDHISSENIHGIRNNPAAAVASKTSHPVKNPASMNYTVRQPVQRKPIQKRTLGRDAQNLLEYFKKVQAENPGFFYAIQLDEDNHMSNVFWADARSRTAYSHFGDAVTLDTTYRVNQYGVPFAPFTGVNHHGQMILFGCALLLDDSEASFVWLFKTFLAAMNDHHPVSITTNQDRAIQTAVSQVFPQARHCLSKWHVLREGPVKLAHVCHMHPNFEIDLYNCINLTETTEEFDSSWNSIIDKYELRGNDWLQSLYSTRAQWVPAYFRDSFFAVMSPNQGYGGYFIDGFVNQHTTLPMFFRQYELAVERWFEKEIESDFETICVTPVLKTPSPMEKQAADLYTRKIFLKFQEELVETFAYTANRIEEDGANSIFRVAKFEDDQKSYTVTLNYSELRANCSCQMFEYSGILCRHVLTVFTVSNVLTLPSHYILKRWTRNAKSSVASDESASVSHKQESLTSRYTSLCREAIRYAEKGAIAVETYDAAMSALKEGGNKVAVMKRSIAKVSEKKTPTSTSDTTPLLWPPKDETTGYTDLCQEPIKYAEEETIAVETYDAAMSAVREVGKKIPVTKRSIAKVAPPSYLVVENAHAEKETPTSTSDTTPLLWRQKDETRRYTNLWQEPIKYAEEGTVAVESYDAAMSAVREIGKKIPVTKRSIAKVAPPNHLVGGNAHAEKETPNSTSDTTPLVWRQKDETRGYTNLCQEPIKYAEEGTIAVETYDVAMSALRQGGKKIAVTKKRSIAKAAPPSHSGNAYAGRKTRTSTSHATPASTGFNLNDAGAPIQPVADLNLPQTATGSHQRDDGPPENMEVVLPSLKSMTWAMENKDSTPENRVAVINLKLQDCSKIPSTESEVKFHLSRVSLEPILEYMAQISEQLSTTANRVAVINLKHQDTQTTSGEPEVKFQVSRDALGAVLRSMTYIREQLTCDGDEQ